jgi:hypothetical protein
MKLRTSIIFLGSLVLAAAQPQGPARAQEKPRGDLGAVAEAQRATYAKALVEEREAASGQTWDDSYRNWFVQRLSSLSPEAFATAQSIGSLGDLSPLLGSTTGELVYTPVTPCRFVDGIQAADRVTATANSTTARFYRVRGSTSSDFVSQGAASSAPSGCGVPTSAVAVAVNLTVADPTHNGDLRADASHLAATTTSALNYTFDGSRGKNLANGAIVPLCNLAVSTCASGATPTSATRDMRVTFHAGDTAVGTFFVADVLGYFTPAFNVATTGCGSGTTFQAILPAACPSSSFADPPCTGVGVGAMCEFDSTNQTCSASVLTSAGAASTFSDTLDNCPGAFDVYIRIR